MAYNAFINNLMYDITMPSITAKKIKGNTYYYARQSKRINGKPKIVWQKYLGRAEDIIAAHDAQPAPKEVLIHELGASAALLDTAIQLNLADIIDRHVPKRTQSVSVGTYLLIATLNRCVEPCSKNAIAQWFDTTILPRALGVESSQLTSQRFWDNMDRIGPDALRNIERDLVCHMVRHFKVDVSQLLFDATNFFTFIDSFNERSSLAQRGHSKEGRKAQRIVGLALLAAADHHVPVLHHTYPGNQPDSPTFRSLVDALVARFHDLNTQHDSNVTLVFDKGNNCEDNIAAVYDSPYHMIGSLVPTQHADLLAVPARRFKPLAEIEGVSVWRTTKQLYGEQYTVVVAKNKNLERTQTATLLREIAKRRQKLKDIQWQLRRWQKGIITKGRRPTLAGTQRKVDECLKARHMKELFEVSVEPGAEDIPKLKYRFNRSAWRRLQRTLLGKNLIFTDRTEWTDAQIVHGYRAQHHVERAFRDMKDVRHIAIRPQYHWTDQKVEVHVFICVMALMLQTLLYRHLVSHGQTISSHQMFDELAGIKEVGVVYPSARKQSAPKIQMTLSSMSDTQKTLYELLQLERYRTG